MYGFNPQNSYQSLPSVFYTPLAPTQVTSPSLVLFNHDLAQALGLNFEHTSNEDKALLFSGNQLPQSFQPLAQAYAGHQFGHFTLLGDGRANLISDHLTPRHQLVDIQLKGAGPTPYARRGDGRAALGPMLREYIISEAMHALNIPTTRALAIVLTGETVYREKALPGAILTRVADSHLRVGTFEYAAYLEEATSLEALFDYALKRHYKALIDDKSAAEKPVALRFLKAVMHKHVSLIIDWMRVGFIHGVMNTDNMSISGQTIDYGPCAFLDDYEPNKVFSSIDTQGRYAFSNQASVAVWNLARLAESILPLIDNDKNRAVELAIEVLQQFTPLYQKGWVKMMGNKIGLENVSLEDKALIESLLNWMHTYHADYTNTFLFLAQLLEEECIIGPKAFKTNILTQYSDNRFHIPVNQALLNWLVSWAKSLSDNCQTQSQALNVMHKMNPNLIPRNHQVEYALKEATLGNLAALNTLLMALKTPYGMLREEFKSFQCPPSHTEKVFQTFCGT